MIIYNKFSNHNTFTYNITIDSKIQSIKRLIGWAGIKCNDNNYISASQDLLLEIVDLLEKNTISSVPSRSTKRVMMEIQFLRNYQNEEISKFQLMYFHNVFSKYEIIFERH